MPLCTLILPIISLAKCYSKLVKKVLRKGKMYTLAYFLEENSHTNRNPRSETCSEFSLYVCGADPGCHRVHTHTKFSLQIRTA